MPMLSKEEALKLAESYADQRFLCSESCLMALAKCQGIESPLIPRIATGFGAGIGRCGETCGAVTGAVMGLSIMYGRDKVEPTKDRRPYWYATELLKRFKEEHGELTCPALLGLDIAKPADYDEYNKKNLWVNNCTKYIQSATGIAWDIIDENK
ncbi:MAG: C-GCAxxG-C-C family protein [Candidatus Bathyarchaeota archaeon]|nr:C-GCAxxG-C-C family protein [Candidatus Bathyarchaeota archaeon]